MTCFGVKILEDGLLARKWILMLVVLTVRIAFLLIIAFSVLPKIFIIAEGTFKAFI